MIPFHPLGLPEFNGEWQCVGYKNDEKMFFVVWRMGSEQDEITIPIKVDKANIIYGLADIGICSIFENNLSVKIREKYNALIIES